MYADSSLVVANVNSHQLSRSELTVEEFREQATLENGLFLLRESGVDEDGSEWEETRYFQDSKGLLPLSLVDTDARWRASRPDKPRRGLNSPYAPLNVTGELHSPPRAIRSRNRPLMAITDQKSKIPSTDSNREVRSTERT